MKFFHQNHCLPVHGWRLGEYKGWLGRVEPHPVNVVKAHPCFSGLLTVLGGALVTNRPLRYSLQNVGNGRWAGLHAELFAAEGSDRLEHAFWGWWLCSMVVEEGRKLDLQYFIQSFRSFNHFLTKRHAQNEPV